MSDAVGGPDAEGRRPAHGERDGEPPEPAAVADQPAIDAGEEIGGLGACDPEPADQGGAGEQAHQAREAQAALEEEERDVPRHAERDEGDGPGDAELEAVGERPYDREAREGEHGEGDECIGEHRPGPVGLERPSQPARALCLPWPRRDAEDVDHETEQCEHEKRPQVGQEDA